MSTRRIEPTTEQMTVLSEVIHQVTRASRLQLPDQEDFSQSVHLKLLERNYDIFQQFSGRSSLRTYLTVVVRRMLLDWRNATQGKWRPSAMATRLGRHAIRLERLIHRDDYATHEAVEIVRADASAPSASELIALAGQLPTRRRHRRVSDECLNDAPALPSEDPIDAAERKQIELNARRAIATAIRRLPEEDRQLVVRRYRHGQSIQSIARSLPIDAKSLYRRYERVLRTLRTSVAADLSSPDNRISSASAADTESVH